MTKAMLNSGWLTMRLMDGIWENTETKSRFLRRNRGFWCLAEQRRPNGIPLQPETDTDSAFGNHVTPVANYGIAHGRKTGKLQYHHYHFKLIPIQKERKYNLYACIDIHNANSRLTMLHLVMRKIKGFAVMDYLGFKNMMLVIWECWPEIGRQGWWTHRPSNCEKQPFLVAFPSPKLWTWHLLPLSTNSRLLLFAFLFRVLHSAYGTPNRRLPRISSCGVLQRLRSRCRIVPC